MRTLARLAALVSKLPGILWVALLVIATVVASGWAIYARGVRHGEVRVHQQALADSTRTAVAEVKAAEARSDTVVKVAAKARATTTELLERRVAVRHAALGELLATDIPKVQTLVALDDSIAAAATVSAAVDAGAIATVLAERAPRAHLDTLRVNAIALDVSTHESHAVRNTLLVVGAAVAVWKGPALVKGLGKALGQVFR